MITAADVFSDPRVVELAEAALAGDEERARRLVAEGVPVDARGRDFWTPLIWAVAKEDARAMDILFRLGASVRAVDRRGRSVMVLSTLQDRIEVLEHALAAGGDPDEKMRARTPITIVAIDRWRWDYLRALLDAGASVDATDERGTTPILRLAILNEYEHVALLIQRRARLDVADWTGLTLAKQVRAAGRLDPASPQAAWRERVRRMLAERGVGAGEGG